MKKLILTALAALGISLSAHAQFQFSSTLTYTNLAQGATNIGWLIDCRGSQYVSIWISSTNDASATDNLRFPFFRSPNGSTSTYETTPVANISIAETGTTRLNVMTNIPVFSAGWLVVPYTTNAAATANAVITLQYMLKKGI